MLRAKETKFALRTAKENRRHFLNSLQVAGKHWRADASIRT